MAYLLHFLTTIAILLPTVLGYNLLFGRGKILHFGPTGLSLVIAYAIFVTQRATGNYVPALLLGLIAALLFSAFFAWLALRLEGDALGILTIAVHLALLAVVLNWSSVTRGALGIPHIPRMAWIQSPESFAIASVSVAAAWIWMMMRIDRSRLGRSLTALAENRFHAESLGISRMSTYLAAFFVAGIGSFVSSVLYPQYIGLLHPNDYQFRFLVTYIMYVVAGGPGSVLGVTLATVLLTVLQEGLRFVPLPYGLIGPVRLILFGLILIVAVYARRRELFPMARSV